MSWSHSCAPTWLRAYTGSPSGSCSTRSPPARSLPGPCSPPATFIGYLLGGAPGAVLATVGIFLPAFVLVAASGPIIPKLRRSPWTADVLDGVNVAALALMIVVSAQLARSAIVDSKTAAIAAVSAILLIYFRVNTPWLILGSGALGFLLLGSHPLL